MPADKGPWAVTVNPVTNMIYVANRLSDKVTVIDGRTNRASNDNLGFGPRDNKQTTSPRPASGVPS